MANRQYYEVQDIVGKLFSVDNFEDYFTNQVDKHLQSVVLNECIKEIRYVLFYCLEQCSRILPTDEIDDVLDEELTNEIELLPNFYKVITYLFKIKDDINIINTLSFPQFYFGLKKCSTNSNFVININKQLSFADEEYLSSLKNEELKYILSKYNDKNNLSRSDIKYLLHFISNYTYDDSLYKYLKDNNLTCKYNHIINNIFTNLLKEENKKFKIGTDKFKILMVNLLRILEINIPLKYDLLLEDGNHVYGMYCYYNSNEFIILNAEIISDIFYENLILIETLFHEIRHYIVKHNKKVNYNNIQFIKDDSLIEYIDGYYNYDMNYHIVSTESDARLHGRIDFHKWLKKVSPNLASTRKIETRDIIKKELGNLKNEFNRRENVEGSVMTTLDELFESLPLDTKIKLIKDNPLLNYEYNLGGKRHYTLDLIIKKFSYQGKLDSLSKGDDLYLKTAENVNLYHNLIFNRILTYDNILDDLKYYKKLFISLPIYFNNDINLHNQFQADIETFYINRIPALLVINKLNSHDKNKSFGMLDNLLKIYKKKMYEFIYGINEDIMTIVNKENNINSKRRR